MRKRGILVGVFFIFVLIILIKFGLGYVYSYNVINLWNATLNGPQNNSDFGLAVTVDNNSNIYVAGSSKWSSATTEDIYLGKFNSSGSNLWNVTINGPQNKSDEGYGIALDSLGNIYVTGYSYWSSPATFDLYLGKFNSSGSNLWNATINGPQTANNYDKSYGVAVDNNSNIYVAGASFWSSAGSYDIYLGKFNSSGSNLWNATINGPQNSNDYGQGIAVDNNSNIYVTGYSLWSSGSTDDIYLGKFNSSGSNLWNATLNGPQNNNDYGRGVAVDNNSNIYVTGYSLWSSATYEDIYLGKFNSSGSNLWNATINGPQTANNYDKSYGVAVDNNSNIYVAGASFWSSAGSYDIYLGKFNSSGSNLWNATINGPQNSNDYGQGIAVDNNSNIYVTGYSLWSSGSTMDIYLGKFRESSKTYNCSSCSDCTSAIADASSGDTILLGNSITSSSTCIDFKGKDNVTFDCQSYSNFIKGPSNYNPIYGIYLNNSNGGSNNNIIRNCNVSAFNYGVYLYSSSNNTLTNITSNSNVNTGIFLMYSNNNNLTNLIISNNSQGVYFYGSSNNNLTNSIVQESNTYELLFTYVEDCNNYITNITGSGGRPFEFYNYTATIQNKILDGLILCNVSNSVVNNVTIQGSDTLNNSLLYLRWVSNSVFSNINSSNNLYGFVIYSSSNNTFTNITANSNDRYGLYISSSNNTFTNITANSNTQYGIVFDANSNSLTNSIAQENRIMDILIGSNNYCNNYITNITGSGGRAIEFYNYTATIQNKVLSELLICNASNSVVNNITIQGSDNLSNNGIYMYNTNNMRLSNINSSNNYYGIFSQYANNNTIVNITANSNINSIYLASNNNSLLTNITSNNNQYSIRLSSMNNNNILINITTNNNYYGLLITSSNNNTLSNSYIQNNTYGFSISGSNNTFYNNYFNNTDYDYPTTYTNFFNTTLTNGTNIVGGSYIGGNFWGYPNNTGFSQKLTTCTDANSDGICDSSYNLDGLNYDYLPLILTAACTESWGCTDWGTCSGGTWTRTCTDLNSCGTTATKPAVSQSCTSGGSSGSSSGTTQEPTATETFTGISPSQPLEMTISNPNLGVTQITVAVTETISSVSLTVTAMSLPQAETGLPTGQPYQSFKIEATGINETNTVNATIEFKVNKTWLTNQNGTASDVSLYRKKDNATMWNPLGTTLLNQDSIYYYFSALSPGFSTFVVFFSKYECQPNAKRCFNGQSQLCLGNSTWLIIDKCRYGCDEQGKCKTAPQSTIIYTMMIALVSVGIIITSYLILTRVRKKRK